jgi:PAS domain S-box-containing protein
MKQGTILIVEDEPIVALDLQQAVEELGYRVAGIAESAEEALVAVEKHRPQLALMDISIAGSMDGIQAAKILRKWFFTPVIFISAFSDERTIARAAKEMALGYLTKPFRSRELAATIELALSRTHVETKERSAHNEMMTAIDACHDGLLLISMEGHVRYMNTAMEALAGLPLRSAYGRPLAELIHLRDESDREIRDLAQAANGDSEYFCCTLTNANDEEIRVDLTVSVPSDTENRPRGIVIAVRNAAARLRHEATSKSRMVDTAFDAAPTAMTMIDAPDLAMDPPPRFAKSLMHTLFAEGTMRPQIKAKQPN